MFRLTQCPKLFPALILACALASTPAAASVERRVVNDGQLVLEDVPPIPPALPRALDRFQQVRSAQFLAWSVDGKSIYIRQRLRGVSQVQELSRPGGETVPLTQFEEPVREARRQYRGSLLAITMNQGGSGLDQIHLFDPETGETRRLTNGEALNNRMVWDRADRRLAYRSTRRNGRSNDLWLMEVADPAGARMIFAAPDGALWKPVSFNRDGRSILVQQYQGVTDSRIHLLDLDTGAMRELVGHAEYETSNVAIDFDEAGRGVFFVTNRRGRSAEIAWIALDGEQDIRYAEGGIGWDISEFELSPDGRRGAFVTNEEGISRLYLFDPRRFKHRRLDRTPVGVISDLRFSPNGRRLGMSISTPRAPGDAWVADLGFFTRSLRRLRRWTEGDVGGLDPESLVVPRLVHYPAPGLTRDSKLWIPAFYYRPPGDGPFPVVIYIHGGPEGQFRPGFNSLVQQWASGLGVAVLAPNVRGSLGYGLTYLSLDDGRRREDAVRDIGALLDWIAKVPDMDSDRVAVFGASYGGYMALAAAVHYSDRLVAAVDRAGISHFVTYLENTQDYRRDLRRVEYGDERDPEMRAFLESISPLNNVDRISVPLLIVQGQNDPVVPVSESGQMVRALRERGQTVWYMNALNEGHGYEKKENRDVYQQVTWLFLRRYLLDR